VKNWKSHQETELHFGDGTNVLIGMMGAGKTAILDAITYALFGTLPSVQSRRIKLDDLIMNRPRSMDSAEVEVDFIAPNGDGYKIRRVLERGKGTTISELRKASGELIESPSSTRVSELVSSILKLDYELFERAIYSEQNRLDYFLTLPRGKRMESIDELLGIDKLELARKNIGSLINRVQDRFKEKQKLVEQIRAEISVSALPALEREIEELELSKKEIQVRVQQLEPELRAVTSQIQKLVEAERKLVQFERDLRELEGSITAISQQLSQIRERLGPAVGANVDQLKELVSSIENSCNIARAQVQELNQRMTSSSSKVRELETRSKMYRESAEKLSVEISKRKKSKDELDQLKLSELNKLIETMQAEFRGKSDELAALKASIGDLKESYEKLIEAEAVCPVCESPLTDDKKRQLLAQRKKEIEDRLATVKKLEAHLSGLEKTIRQRLELQRRGMLLEKEVEDLPKIEEEYARLLQQLSVAGEELVLARAEVEKIQKDLENSRRQADKFYEELLSAKQRLQLRMDLDRLEAEQREKQSRSLRLQQEIWQIKRVYDESKKKELESRYEELVRLQERLKAEFVAKEQIIAEKRKVVEGIRERQKLLEQQEAESKYLQTFSEALRVIQTALARTQADLRRYFIEGVNGVMSKLWEEIYPYKDYVGVRLEVEGGERTGDYVLQLRDRSGNWVAVDGIASGGERTDACLALRIAFATVLAPALNWLVLDEPTHNLDAEGVQELATVLRERIPEVVRQVLLITHEERLEAAVSGYLYRFSRNKNVDEPTKVEQVAMSE
jgi:exonuclease SbcC